MVHTCSIQISFVIILSTVITTYHQNIYERQRGSDLEDDNFLLDYPSTALCTTIPGLTRAQLDICYTVPDVTAVALNGFKLAINECNFQFRHQRWNCSALQTKARNPYTSHLFEKGFRETAFVHAIMSAAVVYSVAKACSQGELVSCTCDPMLQSIDEALKSDKQFLASRGRQTHWKWGGCSHNTHYGLGFSKLFLDSKEQIGDMRSQINLHNNNAGRTIVVENMQIKCKCHGFSGSCEFKTCWKTAASFRTIGNIIKERFRTAHLLNQSNLVSGKIVVHKKEHKVRRKRKRKRKRQQTNRRKKKSSLTTELLYYEKSPSFCDKDSQLDILGTTGRICKRNQTSADSCANMCCGRGYEFRKRKRVENCNCKSLWCCHVQCQQCTIEEWITLCK